MGQERTFDENIADREILKAILLGEVEQVAERLRRKGATATRITLKIRFGDFETVTRSRTISEGTLTCFVEDRGAIFEERAATNAQPVRLLGFLCGFDGPAEDALFNDPRKRRPSAWMPPPIESSNDSSLFDITAQSVRRGDRR